MSERLVKSLFLKRLQQIIASVKFKCLDRIFVISGYKYEQWQILRSELFDHRKAVHARHLDV